jgi:flagellin
MAQTINTNIASLNAQRNLNGSGNTLSTSLQRLSSGLRINSAKDDAAGLAISQRFTSQINGLNQAVRNANDGISLAQTAEGDLTQVGDNLQRIRTLSAQASNATNSKTDREAMQAEVTALTAEIDRVAKQSSFNGTNLLDGSFTSKLFQVGANSGQAISIDKTINAKADALGDVKFAAASTGSAVAATTAATTISGISINGVTIDDVKLKADTTSAAAAAAIVTAINAKISETGAFASVTSSNAIKIESVKANKDLKIGATSAAGLTAATNAYTSADATFLKDVDITTFVGSQRALEIADASLTSVASARADLGAVQNRFSSVVSSLQTTSENLSASRSRILDTDFAEETASMTKAQILQQAGTAMLAQANSLPNNVLTLLQG